MQATGPQRPWAWTPDRLTLTHTYIPRSQARPPSRACKYVHLCWPGVKCRHTDTFRDIHTLTHTHTHTHSPNANYWGPTVLCTSQRQPLLTMKHAHTGITAQAEGPSGVRRPPLWLRSIWQVTDKFLSPLVTWCRVVVVACALTWCVERYHIREAPNSSQP